MPTHEQYTKICILFIFRAAVGSSSWYGLTVVPGAKPTPLAHQQLDKTKGQVKNKWVEEEEVLADEEGDKDGDQEESPVRKQSMFKDIFEEPKEPLERKIEVFSKASKIPSRPSGVGLAEMMKNRLNKTSGESEKEIVIEEEVRRRSGERISSESRSRSRSGSRSREKKKKSKNKNNKSRSRSKTKKKKKYRSSSSPSSPEKRKKKKKKHKVKQESPDRSHSRSKSREEKKKKKRKDRSRSKSQKSKKRKRSRSNETMSSRSRSKEKKFKKRKFRQRSKSYESEEKLKVIPVTRRSASRSMSRGPVSRSMSREVRRSGSQSQDAWRRIEGREQDYSRGSQSRHSSLRRSTSRDPVSRSGSRERPGGDRRSISRGLRSVASESREKSQLERIQESSEEEVRTFELSRFHLFLFVRRMRRQLWLRKDLKD